MGKLKIFSSPYGAWETFIWFVKHIIIDVIYPLLFLLFLFVIIDEIHINVLIVFAVICFVFIAIFLGRWIQRILTPIENIGDLNEDGWREKELNPSDTVVYKIGFVGDIMKMGKYSLRFEKRVIKFFKDADLIVGNLEGIITDKFWLGVAAQKHDISILEQLTGLGHPPEKWLLCTSNNHSADFGNTEFQKSNKIIRDMDFNVFGDVFGGEERQKEEEKVEGGEREKEEEKVEGGEREKEEEKVEEREREKEEEKVEGREREKEEEKDKKKKRNQNFLYPKERPEINLVSGTMWNNQRDHASVGQFENVDNYYMDGKFNILYPHWHYENESYVRRRIKFKSITLILTGYYILFDQIKRKIYKKIRRDYVKIFEYLQKIIPYRKIRRYLRGDRLLNRKYYRKFNPNKYQNWNLIYGHHPHVPQPITQYGSKNDYRLLAFSGGNFTSSKNRKKHISGLIVKCEIGRINPNNQLVLRKVEWSYTINEKEKIEEMKEGKIKKIKVDTVIIDGKRNRTNSFSNWRNRFWTNLFYIICAFLLEFILICSIFGRSPNFEFLIDLEFLKIFREHQVITNIGVIIFFMALIGYYIYRSHRM